METHLAVTVDADLAIFVCDLRYELVVVPHIERRVFAELSLVGCLLTGND
jgi:hypothetical protein